MLSDGANDLESGLGLVKLVDLLLQVSTPLLRRIRAGLQLRVGVLQLQVGAVHVSHLRAWPGATSSQTLASQCTASGLICKLASTVAAQTEA